MHYRKVASEEMPLVEQEVVQVVTDVSTRLPAARLGVFRGLPDVSYAVRLLSALVEEVNAA
ncbi:MAG TPA: hypothetical protein VML54_00880 [Candidatus Limnocylindrales bacterium]|nr:hypothetical protein [Candidatus Limnocylindrales bacterium]